jgi:hypothetical protein
MGLEGKFDPGQDSRASVVAAPATPSSLMLSVRRIPPCAFAAGAYGTRALDADPRAREAVRVALGRFDREHHPDANQGATRAGPPDAPPCPRAGSGAGFRTRSGAIRPTLIARVFQGSQPAS